MQRLEDKINQIEVEIKEVKEKVERENEPALVLALRQELAALRQEKVLVMQQQQNQGEEFLCHAWRNSNLPMNLPKKLWTSSRHNQTSPMHTHLDNSSLCLISSLLSLSSALSMPLLLPRCRLALDETF